MFTFLTRLGRLFVGATAIVAALSIFGFGTLTGELVASKQAPGTGGTIALNGAAAPKFGSHVQLTATFQSMKWLPEESVSCTVNGTNVYLDVQTYNGSSPWTSSWTLSSQTWANAGGAPARCTASLYYYTWQGHTETGIVYLAGATFSTT